ncbi:MAG: arsenate reductase ArsC [Myxococcota bacterium]|nr:arsenate reductase ArsC [Myxococcota bacterium]
MSVSSFHVLFLCTGNSARSIMAEAVLSRFGEGRFSAHSAGSHPTGSPHPMALQVLHEQAYNLEGLRSKSWDEFADSGASDLDLVITVCDNARQESCPIWPGGPIAAHWGVEDPAACEGDRSVQRRAFLHAYEVLKKRIEALIALDVERLDPESLRRAVQKLGGLV